MADVSQSRDLSTLGERIEARLAELGINKADLERRLGPDFRKATLFEWLRGEYQPSADHLRRLAGALEMTIEELLGVADGQEPPFAAWREFLSTPQGASITAGERRMLQAIAWPPGTRPTVASYLVALSAARSTEPRS